MIAKENTHYYASTLATWMVDNDLQRLIDRIETDGMPYFIWMVPLPISASYQIREYAPDVEGAVRIGRGGDK